MRAMRAVDSQPSDGYVQYPGDAACQRRRGQYGILVDAWALVAPQDSLPQTEMSKWLNLVVRSEGEGCEGELVLDALFAFFASPHPHGISFPRRAFWTALYNSLATTPLPKSERTWRGKRS